MNSMNLYWLAFLQRCAYPSLFVCVYEWSTSISFRFLFKKKKMCGKKQFSRWDEKRYSSVWRCQKMYNGFFSSSTFTRTFQIITFDAGCNVNCVLCFVCYSTWSFPFQFVLFDDVPFAIPSWHFFECTATANQPTSPSNVRSALNARWRVYNAITRILKIREFSCVLSVIINILCGSSAILLFCTV